MSEVDWLQRHLEALEAKVSEARKALRDALVAEATGDRFPVNGGLRALFGF